MLVAVPARLSMVPPMLQVPLTVPVGLIPVTSTASAPSPGSRRSNRARVIHSEIEGGSRCAQGHRNRSKSRRALPAEPKSRPQPAFIVVLTPAVLVTTATIGTPNAFNPVPVPEQVMVLGVGPAFQVQAVAAKALCGASITPPKIALVSAVLASRAARRLSGDPMSMRPN